MAQLGNGISFEKMLVASCPYSGLEVHQYIGALHKGNLLRAFSQNSFLQKAFAQRINGKNKLKMRRVLLHSPFYGEYERDNN
ncbi:MAG: hypothetical protein ACI4RP_03620 [Acutalibacteraceae bacterium]